MKTMKTLDISPIKLAGISQSIVLPFLIINDSGEDAAENTVKESVIEGFTFCAGVFEVMDAIDSGKNSIIYLEKNSKLDPKIETVGADFSAGIINFADIKAGKLRTSKFNPFKTSLIIVADRSKIEESNSRLFEYFGFVATI